MKNLFKEALKNKTRFNYKGLINLEDLFDLSIESLDKIYQGLQMELKQFETKSLLVNENSIEKNEVELKAKIVEEIAKDKIDERAKIDKQRENKAQKELILKAIETKEIDAINNLSVEELKAKYDELD